MGALEKIETALKDIISALQMAKLYSPAHQIFKASVAKSHESLTTALSDRRDLVIGIVGDELAFEKEIFFQLSKTAANMITYIKQKGIERLTFYPGVEQKELESLFTYLSAPNEETKDKLPQDYLNLYGVKNINVGKIKVNASERQGDNVESEATKESAKLENLYSEAQADLSGQLENILSGGQMDYLVLRLAANNVMENLASRRQELLALTTVKRYDLGTFTHIMNVCILAMHFSTKLGFPRHDVLDIGIAALFHDIGKLYISRRIINKNDKLTTEEFEKIKSHTVLGAEILLKYVNTLGILPVVVAFEHHLKYNLEGYPKLTFQQKPNVASLLVSICDVYDALSEKRSYKSDYPADIIYDFMMKEKGRLFEPQLLDDFFRIMGVWPIGTIVRLSDSRIAVVRSENESDIFCPHVEVIFPEDQRQLLDISQIKDKVKIERQLNPFTEAKSYLHLI